MGDYEFILHIGEIGKIHAWGVAALRYHALFLNFPVSHFCHFSGRLYRRACFVLLIYTYLIILPVKYHTSLFFYAHKSHAHLILGSCITPAHLSCSSITPVRAHQKLSFGELPPFSSGKTQQLIYHTHQQLVYHTTINLPSNTALQSNRLPPIAHSP